jgi:hypothetical protein
MTPELKTKVKEGIRDFFEEAARKRKESKE